MIDTFPPRPRWRGFSFALHPDMVQGFSFARMQYSRIQAFTACFAASMQLCRPRHKTAHRALQELFLRLHPLNRPRYQTDKSGYNITCATLERLPTPGRPPPIPDTTATPGRCTGQHSPPIIIMYIRGCRGAPCCGSMPDGAAYRRPCQPGGVNSYRVRIAGKCFPHAVQNHPRKILRPITPGGWRSGTLHPARQSSSRGAEPLAASAASLFGLSPDS